MPTFGWGSAATGTVGIDGAATTWANRAFYIGQSGTGTLNIANGAAVGGPVGATGINPWAIVGDNFGSQGTVAVDGAGSTWYQLTSLSVGASGSGTMTITNGGAVIADGASIGSNSGSTGAVAVNGIGSTWNSGASDPYNDGSGNLYVGNSGRGTLAISNGATVTSGNGYYGDAVGNGVGSVGSITISGAGSKWTGAGDIYVGNNGNGTVSLTNGATVLAETEGAGIAGGSCVGYQPTSTGVLSVDGAGSSWTSRYSFSVGYKGNGTLQITNGGSVTAGPYIGFNSGSTGVVTVSGTGSTWALGGALYVGYSGGGTLNLANGGSVVVAGPTHVADNAGSSGVVNFGSGGGTLTTQTLWTSAPALLGIGTVNAKGLVTDVNLLFDSTHGASQTFTMNEPGQNVTVNLDLSNPSTAGDFGVGYTGSGSAAIRDGVTVNCQSAYLGYQSGSSGAMTVTGTGSQLSNSSGFLSAMAAAGHWQSPMAAPSTAVMRPSAKTTGRWAS